MRVSGLFSRTTVGSSLRGDLFDVLDVVALQESLSRDTFTIGIENLARSIMT